MRDIYVSGEYLKNNEDWHASRAGWKAGHVIRGLEAVGVKPATLCDIGCGTALTLNAVASHFGLSHAVGFEPSSDAPVHPETQAIVERRQMGVEATSDHFDVALMLDVFEHVEDYYGFIRSSGRVADHVVFHIPLDANLVTLVKSGFMGPRDRIGHLHYYTPETALATLRDCGFKVLHWHFTKAGWDGPDRNPNSPLNLVRRLLFALSPKLQQRLTGGLALLAVTRSPA